MGREPYPAENFMSPAQGRTLAYLILAAAALLGFMRVEATNRGVQALVAQRTAERKATIYNVCETLNRRTDDLSQRLVDIIDASVRTDARLHDYAVERLTIPPENCQALVESPTTPRRQP